MRYQVFTAVESIEADSRLEAVDKFCNKQVVILVEEQKQEGDRKIGHEFIRTLAGCKDPKEKHIEAREADGITAQQRRVLDLG